MGDFVYSHLDEGLYFNPKVQILFGIWLAGVKPAKLKSLGDYETCELAYEIEETELERNDSRVRTVARTDITKKSGTLTVGARQLIPAIKEAMYLSAPAAAVTQALAANQTLPVAGVAVGDIYETGKLGITTVSIVEGVAPNEIAFVENTHFKVDSPTGRIEILALPALATGNGVVIKYTAPAILEAAGRKEFGLLTGEGVTLRMVLRGLHDNGDDIVIPKIKFRVDGNLVLGQSGSEFANVSLTGKIISDITEAAGRDMGYAISIPAA